MKKSIKYSIVFFVVFIIAFFIMLLLSNFFYNLYIQFIYNGNDFYGEESGKIMSEVICYIFLPLSILSSFTFSFIIFYIKKMLRKK
jgi:hypothetical protein